MSGRSFCTRVSFQKILIAQGMCPPRAIDFPGVCPVNSSFGRASTSWYRGFSSNDATSDASTTMVRSTSAVIFPGRSEEHTSGLQARGHLVCRLLLEKKKYSQLPLKLYLLNIQVIFQLFIQLNIPRLFSICISFEYYHV